MIIAIADAIAIRENEIDFAVAVVCRAISRHKTEWVVIGNVIVATSEAELNKAIRSLPVNRTGDGLL